MRIKRIKLNKKLHISFIRSGLLDSGKGWDYIRISLNKRVNKNHYQTIFSFYIKDFNLLKFKTSV
jgi:hypothetical protein